MRRVHHLGIVVRDLDQAVRFFFDGLGLEVERQAVIEDQGVRAALLPLANAALELIEPLTGESGVGRYLERRGEGLHHICFTSAALEEEMQTLQQKGIELIDAKPRDGLAGRVCFIHPRAHAGVLVELVEALG